METLDPEMVIDAWAHVPPRHRAYGTNHHEHVERALMILIGKMGSDWAKECALALYVNCEPDLKNYRLPFLERIAREAARRMNPWMEDGNRKLSEWVREKITQDSNITETQLTNQIYDHKMMGATWWNIRKFVRKARRQVVIEEDFQGYNVTDMLMEADDGREIEVRRNPALFRELVEMWQAQRREQHEDLGDAAYEEYGVEVDEYIVQKLRIKPNAEIDHSRNPSWVEAIVERHRKARRDQRPVHGDGQSNP